MSCPSSLIAGDTWSWGVVDTDRSPADGWSLEFRLSGSTSISLTVATNAAGDGWDVTYAATSSASVAAGRYEWFARCTKGATVQTIARGTVTVAPNITATNIDGRSWAEQTLAVVEAALAGRMTSAMQEYEIAGRKAKFYSLVELLPLRDQLRSEVKSEEACARAAAGLPSRSRIMVRFGP